MYLCAFHTNFDSSYPMCLQRTAPNDSKTFSISKFFHSIRSSSVFFHLFAASWVELSEPSGFTICCYYRWYLWWMSRDERMVNIRANIQWFQIIKMITILIMICHYGLMNRKLNDLAVSNRHMPIVCPAHERRFKFMMEWMCFHFQVIQCESMQLTMAEYRCI